MADHLHVDKAKIEEWEIAEQPIPLNVDRSTRLLVANSDPEVARDIVALTQQLENTPDESGRDLEIRVNVKSLVSSVHYVRAA
jgi:hypothetical protein